MQHFNVDIHLLRTLIINAITGGVALGLLRNRLRNKELEPRAWPEDRTAPLVEIIIPVRNEERNIGPLLASLLKQDYPSRRFHITVVDDASTDRTPSIVARIALTFSNVRVLTAPPLPPGWTGKNHAMYTGLLASPKKADYLLLVDADTRHSPLMLSTVVSRAEEQRIDLLSLIIDVETRSFWERVIVPQMGEFYTLLVGTMDSVNDPRGGAAANGQFMLIKRDLYAQLGALESVRGDVAEDKAIAGGAKAAGATVRLEYGRRLVRARVYSSLREMWEGYSKTLFWATGRNTGKSLAVALALALYAIVPPAALLHALLHRQYQGRTSALRNAPFQLLPMLALRVAVCRRMGIPPAYAFTYPLGVLVGDGMLLFSLYRVRSGKGVQWKGRTYF